MTDEYEWKKNGVGDARLWRPSRPCKSYWMMLMDTLTWCLFTSSRVNEYNTARIFLVGGGGFPRNCTMIAHCEALSGLCIQTPCGEKKFFCHFQFPTSRHESKANIKLAWKSYIPRKSVSTSVFFALMSLLVTTTEASPRRPSSVSTSSRRACGRRCPPSTGTTCRWTATSDQTPSCAAVRNRDVQQNCFCLVTTTCSSQSRPASGRVLFLDQSVNRMKNDKKEQDVTRK